MTSEQRYLMKEEELYLIGEAAEKVRCSRKALRFYDSIGILPSERIADNGYRYYSKNTLLIVPVIKYYKQMGFQIDEMRDLIKGTTFGTISRIFSEKLDELTCLQEHIAHQYRSVHDWNSMISEAMEVIDHQAVEVGARFFEPDQYLFFEQPYKADYRDAVINLEFTNYIESVGNKITGPVIRHFGSLKDRLAGTLDTQTMLQKPLKAASPDQLTAFGGKVMLCAYHIGSYDTVFETYERIIDWASRHHYRCESGVYERYVVDRWLTNDNDQLVTQIIMESSR